MSTITYDVVPDVRTKTAPVRKRKGFFARLIEARQRQADQDLRRHGLHLPRELEDAGLKLNPRKEDSLPFIR
jgi:hypothetical protein